MADRKISELPLKATAADGDILTGLDSEDGDANIRFLVEAVRAPLVDSIAALAARVVTLEGYHPVAHTVTRYIAIKANVLAAASDFTALDALGGGSSEGDILDTPASDDPATVGIFLPASEGRLIQVAELDANGNPNPFGAMQRGLFDPQPGQDDVVVDIPGSGDHYVYATNEQIFAIFLGSIKYQVTQG